jgi:hypothetical protein
LETRLKPSLDLQVEIAEQKIGHDTKDQPPTGEAQQTLLITQRRTGTLCSKCNYDLGSARTEVRDNGAGIRDSHQDKELD